MNSHSIAASLLITGLLGACSSSVERQLEGHVFDIPKVNDIADSDTPFFFTSARSK
uniref:hypothetical protein n=1 Tax=Edaphosphingomonas laterariae TaxID=861865 RepID=UPI001C528547|nr:hypothetical protein [Sphingomonas laterariae]